MKNQTGIQWTDETWNPLAGCSKCSDGCKFCYAIKDAIRLAGNPNEKVSSKYAGTAANGNWTGKINLASDDVLTQPLRWTRPRRIFVNSMSDLFHESVPDEWIDRIFAVMALSPQHTFQILTKRAERMERYFYRTDELMDATFRVMSEVYRVASLPSAGDAGLKAFFSKAFVNMDDDVRWFKEWPLPNVWLGVSVENQKAADERIPHLLKTPAAVRFLSVEPLLEKVVIPQQNPDGYWPPKTPQPELAALRHKDWPDDFEYWTTGVNWVIVGGESGPNARPCNVDWIRSIVGQCQSAKVPVFVKQLGGNVWARNDNGFEGDTPTSFPMDTVTVEDYDNPSPYQGELIEIRLNNKKGGDPFEWPEDLRVREFPGVSK